VDPAVRVDLRRTREGLLRLTGATELQQRAAELELCVLEAGVECYRPFEGGRRARPLAALRVHGSDELPGARLLLQRERALVLAQRAGRVAAPIERAGQDDPPPGAVASDAPQPIEPGAERADVAGRLRATQADVGLELCAEQEH